jgi:hypothetical protein
MIFSQPISERRRRGSPKPQHVDKKGVAERHQHHTSQLSTPSSNVTTRLAAAALAARLTYQADYQHDDGSAQRRDLVGRPECPEGMVPRETNHRQADNGNARRRFDRIQRSDQRFGTGDQRDTDDDYQANDVRRDDCRVKRVHHVDRFHSSREAGPDCNWLRITQPFAI